MKYTYIQNERVKALLKLANDFSESLQYPNCENSRDERRYSEIYEERILEIMEKHALDLLSKT